MADRVHNGAVGRPMRDVAVVFKLCREHMPAPRWTRRTVGTWSGYGQGMVSTRSGHGQGTDSTWIAHMPAQWYILHSGGHDAQLAREGVRQRS